jgi:hypothetical protein
MTDLVTEVPGYADAIARETLIRDAAFLGQHESIAGFEVVPITLRRYLLLSAAKNPLVAVRKTPVAPLELVAFLWALHPEHGDQAARKRFLVRCRAFCPPELPWIHTPRAMRRCAAKYARSLEECLRVTQAAREYMAEAMQDEPPRAEVRGFRPAYYSSAAFWCAQMAREYHFSMQETLDMPLKVLHQFAKEYQSHTSDVPLFNPSGKVLSDWLAGRNAN